MMMMMMMMMTGGGGDDDGSDDGDDDNDGDDDDVDDNDGDDDDDDDDDDIDDDDDRFLSHLTVSRAVPVAVSRSDLPHLLQREPDFAVTSDNEQVTRTRRALRKEGEKSAC